MKHRKLFSAPNDTLSCPYDSCDPYYSTPFSPPLAPQTPPILPAKRGHHIPPSVIIIATLLGSCFFLVSIYFILVKYFSGHNPFRPRRRQQEAIDEDFLDQNHGPVLDHPIWYINTVGLQQSAIDSIAIFRYKKGDYLIEGTECAVCLNEFQNDETLRLLPKCSHAFHIPCIDTWLRSHTNCPVCRARIISNPVSGSTPVDSVELNPHSLRRDEDLQVENLENDEEMSTSQVRDEESCENRGDTGDSASFMIDDPDNKMMMEGKDYEVQSVRRSISLDSLLAASIGRAVVNNLCLDESEDIFADQNADVDNVSENNIVGNSRRSRILPKRPTEMKRSVSFAGRSFLSRQNSKAKSLLPS